MEKEAGMEGSTIGASAFSLLSPPALLHVYWWLHAIHLVLAAITLWSWWRLRRIEEGERRKKDQWSVHDTIDAQSSLLPAPLNLLLKTAPWLCLGLLFWIPGIYLEWPSDPWEHLRRINEWRLIDTPEEHTYWHKSAYFIPYSMLGLSTAETQLFRLDLYYTGACLLLSWQYYRLARACNFSRRMSLLLIVAQSLLFGNNIFSFYRYYGISSTIYAQIGAVALTRAALKFAARQTDLRRVRQGDPSGEAPIVSPVRSQPIYRYGHTFWNGQALARFLASSIFLIPFIAFHHWQGLGIAALSVAAVAAWRLIEWRCSLKWWLIGGVVAVNLFFLSAYPRATTIATFRAEGWLSAWLGFDLLFPSSPAANRAMQILGSAGILNIVAAVLLARRNHVVAWLTLMPYLAVLMPMVAVPLAEQLSSMADNYIVLFHRMFFASPPLLAIIALTVRLPWQKLRLTRTRQLPGADSYGGRRLIWGASVATLALLVALPPNEPVYMRTWHALHVTPEDLRLRGIVRDLVDARNTSTQAGRLHVLPTHAARVVESALLPKSVAGDLRTIRTSSLGTVQHEIAQLVDWVTPIRPHNASDLFTQDSVQGKSLTTSLISATSSSEPPRTTMILFGAAPLPQRDAWITHRDTRLEYNLNEHTAGEGGYILQNPIGEPSWVFNKLLIPIRTDATYELSITVRQHRGPPAKTYLAVAWHDSSGSLLDAKAPPPTGAGNPEGWHNGIYSYFGLEGVPAEPEWTTHEVRFGFAEARRIPPNAQFFSVGALLNTEGSPGSVSQIRAVQVAQVAARELIAIPFFARANFTPQSQSGLLSGHWPPEQTALDQAGHTELVTRARQIQSASEFSMRPTQP